MRHRKPRESNSKLTTLQWKVLSAINEELHTNGLIPRNKDLVEKFNISYSSVEHVLSALDKKRFIDWGFSVNPWKDGLDIVITKNGEAALSNSKDYIWVTSHNKKM